MTTTRWVPRWRGIGLCLFAVLSLADLCLTRALLGDGLSAVYEANPLAAWCLKTSGWVGLAVFKFGAVLLAGGCIVLVGRHRPRAGGRLLAAACSTLALVVIYSSFLLVISAPINADLRAENERTVLLDREVARQQEIRAARSLARAPSSPR